MQDKFKGYQTLFVRG